MVTRKIGIFMALVGCAACGVDPPPASTGGVNLGTRTGDCDRGVALVTSDYKSTNIVVTRPDGAALSPSFISSGVMKPGLSLALSGDVDVPSVAPASGRLVLLDRFGSNVVTWLNLETAGVLAQLPIGQGFESNPQDYIELDADLAFVSRFGSNPQPGHEPADEGGDLLLIDTRTPAIVARVAMPEEDPGLVPAPSGMTRLGDDVIVTLSRAARDFSRLGDGRLVGVSATSHELSWTLDLPGLSSCGRAAVSPSRTRLAVACSSLYNPKTKQFDPKASDLVLLDAESSPPRELSRFGLGIELNAGVQPGLAFASEEVLVIKTFANAASGDRAYTFNLNSGERVLLHEASGSFVLNGLRCSPGCGDVCLLSDASSNLIRRWRVKEGGVFESMAVLLADSVVGLPPRSMGGL